jgi:hypothetical protein
MHKLIAHFQRIAPTWLLISYDWSATQQAKPFMPACSDIVIIGRVRWFEGSKHKSKDNFAWYRFDMRHSGGPVFHWLDARAKPPSLTSPLLTRATNRSI